MTTETIVDTKGENPNSEKDTDKTDELLSPPPSDVRNNAEGFTPTASEALESDQNGDAIAHPASIHSTATDDEPVKKEDVTEGENSAAQQSLANDIATDALASFHSSETQNADQAQEQQEQEVKAESTPQTEDLEQERSGEASSTQPASGAEMPSLDNGISPSLLYGNASAAQAPYNSSYHASTSTTYPSSYLYSNQKTMVPHPRPYSAIVAGTPDPIALKGENGNSTDTKDSPSNDNSSQKRPTEDSGGADSFAPPSSVKRQRPNTDSTVIAPANIIPNPQPSGHTNGDAHSNGQRQQGGQGQVPANQPPPPPGMHPQMYHQFHNWGMFNFPQMGRPQGAAPGGDYSHFPTPPPLPGSQSRPGSVVNGTRTAGGPPPRNIPNATPPAGCYSRKEKALGLLAQKLIALYECQQPPAANSNMMQVLSIDQTASKLGVERRRIYDIINILEALDVVTKKGKNMYWWHGLGKIQETFMKMQREAIQSEEFREDAEKNGMLIGEPIAHQVSGVEEEKNESTNQESDDQHLATKNADESNSQSLPPFSAAQLEKGEAPAKEDAPGKESPLVNAYSAALLEKGKGRAVRRCSFGSLGTLSKKFLQLYLVGYDALSLGEATERLLVQMGTMKKDDMNTDPSVSKTHRKRDEEVKGWKTKVRRLYDIANVLVSIGIIDKTTTPSHNKILASNGKPVQMHKNNQYFCWRYNLSPSQILDLNKEKGPLMTTTTSTSEEKAQVQENYVNWPDMKEAKLNLSWPDMKDNKGGGGNV